jgi:hypothetical protein
MHFVYPLPVIHWKLKAIEIIGPLICSCTLKHPPSRGENLELPLLKGIGGEVDVA